MLPTYSIAIRTLGTSGEKFVQELNSIAKQTIKPEKIFIYIAQGYKRPTYSIGIEEYIEVPKGMVAQRALDYKEISSEYILMLDDDVELAPNSAELLLNAAVNNNADCVAADTFQNHKMSNFAKLYNICCNLTLPLISNVWGRKVLSNGSLAYNNNPVNVFYRAQAAEGPASMWKKQSFINIKYYDEKWLDQLSFAYGDDQVMFYKLYANGYNLGITYNSGIKHLDSKTSSGKYHSSTNKFITRSQASFIIWHRSLYNVNNISITQKLYRLISYIIKQIWLIPILLIAALVYKNIKIPIYHFIGIYKGIKFINSANYKNTPNYIVFRRR